MKNIEKLKQYQRWRAGEDERVMKEAVPFSVTETIDNVIREHGEMYDVIERLVNPENCKKDIIHIIGNAESLLSKARGEA